MQVKLALHATDVQPHFSGKQMQPAPLPTLQIPHTATPALIFPPLPAAGHPLAIPKPHVPHTHYSSSPPGEQCSWALTSDRAD